MKCLPQAHGSLGLQLVPLVWKDMDLLNMAPSKKDGHKLKSSRVLNFQLSSLLPDPLKCNWPYPAPLTLCGAPAPMPSLKPWAKVNISLSCSCSFCQLTRRATNPVTIGLIYFLKNMSQNWFHSQPCRIWPSHFRGRLVLFWIMCSLANLTSQMVQTLSVRSDS